MISPERFDRDYFENGVAAGVSCYENYRWLPDLTIPMARAMMAHLRLFDDDTVLDFGCAKGYVVRALRMIGLNAHGADVSEYAINAADEFTRPFLHHISPGGLLPSLNGSPWSWIIAKDVLEHLSEPEVRDAFRAFQTMTHKVFIVVPLGDGGRYVIPEMERDVTHQVRRPLGWWSNELNRAGFRVVSAHFALPGIKDNWTTRYPHGNGFFIAE